MASFIETYRPKTMNQIIGNKTTIQNIFNWIQSPSSKLSLIHGPTGIGKTLTIQLICEKLNIDTHYIDNTLESIDINIYKSLNLTNPITRKKNYIIIEEIDTIGSLILDEIVKDINNIRVPIICLSNTNYIPPIKSITDKITQFKLYPPNITDITSFILPILRENKISLKQNELLEIINNCKCDVRYISNTLEMFKYGKNNLGCKDHTSLNMFDVGKELFNMNNSIETKYDLFFLEYSLMPLFVQENYINNTLISKCEANKLNNISNSAFELSSSDLFETKLHESNDWDLEKYVATSVIKATEKCNTKMVQFPEYFKKNRKNNLSNSNSLNYYHPIGTVIDKLSIEKPAKKIKSSPAKKKNEKISAEQSSEITCNQLIIPKNKKRTTQQATTQQATTQQATIPQSTIPQSTIPQATIPQATIPQATIQQQSKEIKKNDESKEHTSASANATIANATIAPVVQPSAKKNKVILKPVEIEEEIKMEDNILTCTCGSIIKKSSKSAHLKSKKHLDSISKK